MIDGPVEGTDLFCHLVQTTLVNSLLEVILIGDQEVDGFGSLNRLLELGKIHILSKLRLARMRLEPLQNCRHHTGGEIIGNAPQSRIELREEVPDIDIDDILFSKDKIVILKK